MSLPPPPLPLDQLPYGTKLVAGTGTATVIADMDFETFSEAGHVWNSPAGKWECLPGASQGKKGLPIVGAARYAEHPSTEVLCLWFDLKDGKGRQFWMPKLPPPFALFDHIASGKLIEAWNVGFERWIWEKVCMPKYGWPVLPHGQLRCAMAKSRASAYPGALGMAGDVLKLTQKKDKEGDRLIKKFCMPRQPTKADRRKRIWPIEEEQEALALYRYGQQDIVTEAEASSKVPDLEGEELEYWQLDQAINHRGVQVDVEGVHDCIDLIHQAHDKYNLELQTITGGAVTRASELAKMQAWFKSAHNLHFDSLDEEHLDGALLRDDLPPDARRALEIRSFIGSAAVKKVFAMANMVCEDGRLHDLFLYHGARTGRCTGSGPQPTNLPNSGPEVIECHCKRHFAPHHTSCPWCGMPTPPGKRAQEWNAAAVEDALLIIKSRSLELLEYYFGDAMAAVSGCLRGLFIAAPGKKLICSDYSSIEAVVLAEMAGEQWRIDVFKTHGKIYEQSASKITGIDFVEYMRYYGYSAEQLAQDGWWEQDPAAKGSHHPTRKTIGKVAELACFGPHTQVLTQKGFVPIVHVTAEDKLWDGVEWVSHRGVILKGMRPVIDLDGVCVTPNHPISVGASWVDAWLVRMKKDLLSRALSFGGSNLPPEASIPHLQPYTTSHNRSAVFDILNAGPRHRFTIKTNAGYLIVHNSGYQGWIGAWKAFGADAFFTDDEMKKAILAWRAASSAIVELWGGQPSWKRDEYYGLEGMFVCAVLNPGIVYEYRGHKFVMRGDALYLKLLSGRILTYHAPRLRPSDRNGFSISYEGWNSNPKNGATGWLRMDTWGGRLAENCCQATARDIQRFGMLNLEKAGYPVVLHVYDEDIVEVPENFGSVEEVERIMATMPGWAAGWPIKAKGGWSGRRYRK